VEGVKKGIKLSIVEGHIYYRAPWDSVTKADWPSRELSHAISVCLLHLLHHLRLQLRPGWLGALVFMGGLAPLANSSLEHPQMRACHNQLSKSLLPPHGVS